MIDPTRITAARRALGRQLAAYRKAAGLSQHQLAPQVHYGRSTIANVEIGRQNVPREFWTLCDQAVRAGGALLHGYDELAALAQRQQEEQAVHPAPSPAAQPLQDLVALAAQPSAHTLLLHAVRTGTQAAVPASLLAAVDAVRRSVDQTLAEGTTADQLDRLEETVDGHAYDCTYTPPVEMLCRLTLDIAQVRAAGGWRPAAGGPAPPASCRGPTGGADRR
jgi:DNA-binding XRE family transcriptional regulator